MKNEIKKRKHITEKERKRPVRRIRNIIRLEGGQNQSKASTAIRRSHRSAFHQLILLKSPFRNRSNSTSRGAHTNPQMAVISWPARRPKVLGGIHLFQKGVGCV